MSGARHPGRSAAKAASTLKGRQSDAAAAAEVRALIGKGPLARDLLIEYLHLLQDRYGHLSDRHLAALAAEMRLSLAEVYEVATFYHAFDVVKDGAEAPPAVTIRVCDSLVCALQGAAALTAELNRRHGADVRVSHGACMGRCESAPVASVNRSYIARATPAKVAAALAGDVAPDRIEDVVDFAAYRSEKGYGLLEQCLAGERKADEIVASLEESGLRGLGGAGFPTGQKWRFVRAEAGPRLMAVNADESEPGTFKDRYYLERDPHRFIEGMLIGAWAVEAGDVYIYLRGEYPELHALLRRELAAVEAAGLLKPEIHLRRGAGAYICGEESAMLESIEGKRGLPRHKPPFPSQVGLYGRPTLINNVETLYWVRDMIEKGSAWHKSHGAQGHEGLRSFSVSGRVTHPGVVLAPAGISVQALIDDYCGGMAEGHSFKAFLPGGASGGIFPAAMSGLALDFGVFEAHGGLIGSAALIVLSDQDDIASAVLNLTRFFEDESCGQCTPCRLGTAKAAKLMAAGDWDSEKLGDLAAVMADASICGLGQAAANPIRCAFKYFKEDL